MPFHKRVSYLAGLLAALIAVPAIADEDATFYLTIKDHRFDPAQIKVPAVKPFVLHVHNLDADAEEFDSDDLKAETVIAGKGEGTVHLRALKAGRYGFHGEYHPDSARGVLIAEQELLMLATLIIVFREVIEAGLVIGIVLAATRGVHRRGRWVSCGILSGTAGACIVAAFADSIGRVMEGAGQQLFNASVLAIAVLMLTWHNVWMARHGREIAVHIKHAGEAVAAGRRSLAALAIVVGVAVLREGAEIVLFLYGVALSGGDTAVSMMIGGAFGLLLGAGISATMYFGLMRIPARHLFTVTSWLIALLAAGMASQAMVFLQQAGLISAFSQSVWDTSAVLSDRSLAGKALHTLIGYTDRPTGIQLIAYAATLAGMFTLMRLFGHSGRGRADDAASATSPSVKGARTE